MDPSITNAPNTDGPGTTASGSIRTSDLYEAAYYLAEGFPPERVSSRQLNRELLCDFYFQGEGIEERQLSFLTNQAVVNLLLFRRSYAEIANDANNAKRDYRREEKAAGGSAAGRKVASGE